MNFLIISWLILFMQLRKNHFEFFNNQLTHSLYATEKKSFYFTIKSTATHTKYLTLMLISLARYVHLQKLDLFLIYTSSLFPVSDYPKDLTKRHH